MIKNGAIFTAAPFAFLIEEATTKAWMSPPLPSRATPPSPSGGLELAHLSVHALAVRPYPCAGMNHGMILPLYSAPEKPFLIKGLFDVRNS
jgi:hypothetical protein